MPRCECEKPIRLEIAIMPGGEVRLRLGDLSADLTFKFQIEELLAEWANEKDYWRWHPSREEMDGLPSVIAALQKTATKLQGFHDEWKTRPNRLSA